MLTQISLNNFKCFKELSLKTRPITVLIGPNGTGKSTCIQSLVLLKQSQDSDVLAGNGPYLNLGDYSDLVFNKDENEHIKMRIEGKKAVLEPEVLLLS